MNLVSAVALIDESGQVLMQRRPLNRQHGGLWEFPGGKIEPGENAEQAARRELREELGVEVHAVEPVGFSGDTAVTLLLFACRAWLGSPASSEGARLQWLELRLLPTLPMPPLDYPLVTPLRRHLAG